MNTNGTNNASMELTIPCVFDLVANNGSDLCLKAPEKYLPGENVTVSSHFVASYFISLREMK
jgi:hypothetical protein